MDSQLNLKSFTVNVNRDIIFKKYNGKPNEIIRLDINIDLLPKEKGYFYTDENGNKLNETLYVDMSSKDFIVYNEDLKKCGYYDYNKEIIIYHRLPLNKKIIQHTCISNASSIKKLENDVQIELNKLEKRTKENVPIISSCIKTTFSDKNLNKKESCKIGEKKYLKTKSGDIVDITNNSIVGYYQNDTNKAIFYTDVLYDEEQDEDKEDDEDDDDDDYAKEYQIDYRDPDDILLEKAILESLKHMSGIKAEERIKKQQNKYKIKEKNTSIIFEDEEIRKLMT